MQRTRVRSLVRELRSYVLRSQKTKPKQTNQPSQQFSETGTTITCILQMRKYEAQAHTTSRRWRQELNTGNLAPKFRLLTTRLVCSSTDS